jgi:hypothetical protein
MAEFKVLLDNLPDPSPEELMGRIERWQAILLEPKSKGVRKHIREWIANTVQQLLVHKDLVWH